MLAGSEDIVLDVTFEGRRVWSFWLLRDSVERAGHRWVEWPGSLVPFLDGHCQLAVLEHLTGEVVYDAPTQFGTSADQIAIVNAEGKALGIDKSGRMAQTFDTRSAEQVAPLLDSIDEVLGALKDAGIEAFPAYGTLLGAVREGKLIGHDSDADLGYVSKHENPVDVIRESFRLQRRLSNAGYKITRYSAIAFKVDVKEADGSVRGLDVFGGFLCQGRLYLMGEVGETFEREWIFPLGTTTLEGRTLPAPAVPEKLLEAMYGRGWKVPDPAFHFETPASTHRRLNGWFRGTRTGRDAWSRFFSTRRHTLPEGLPSEFAQFVASQEQTPARVVDLGCGRAGDAVWLARQGHHVTGYDFVPTGSLAAQKVAADEGLDLKVESLNLNEWRSVFGVGTKLAHAPGPAVVIANHVADAVGARTRKSLWRVASMALRQGGRLYLNVWVGGGQSKALVHPVPMRVIERELAAAGFVVQHQEIVEDQQDSGRQVGRLVAQVGVK